MVRSPGGRHRRGRVPAVRVVRVRRSAGTRTGSSATHLEPGVGGRQTSGRAARPETAARATPPSRRSPVGVRVGEDHGDSIPTRAVARSAGLEERPQLTGTRVVLDFGRAVERLDGDDVSRPLPRAAQRCWSLRSTPRSRSSGPRSRAAVDRHRHIDGGDGISAVTSMLPVSVSVNAGGGGGLAEVPRLAKAARARTMSDGERRGRARRLAHRCPPAALDQPRGRGDQSL